MEDVQALNLVGKTVVMLSILRRYGYDLLPPQ